MNLRKLSDKALLNHASHMRTWRTSKRIYRNTTQENVRKELKRRNLKLKHNPRPCGNKASRKENANPDAEIRTLAERTRNIVQKSNRKRNRGRNPKRLWAVGQSVKWKGYDGKTYDATVAEVLKRGYKIEYPVQIKGETKIVTAHVPTSEARMRITRMNSRRGRNPSRKQLKRRQRVRATLKTQFKRLLKKRNPIPALISALSEGIAGGASGALGAEIYGDVAKHRKKNPRNAGITHALAVGNGRGLKIVGMGSRRIVDDGARLLKRAGIKNVKIGRRT